MRAIIAFIIALFFCSWIEPSGAIRDRLLSAVLMADVAYVRELLRHHEEGILSSNVDIVVDRVEPTHSRTSLLQCGFDPQSKRVEQLDKNCTEITQLLHAAGANLLHRDKYGATAITMGAMKGFSKMIEYLIRNNVPVNSPDNNGRTPLMIATTHAHTRAVTTLLENGASMASQDNAGWTALHFATRQVGGHAAFRPVLDALLSATAGNSTVLDLRDADGRTPLMYSVLQETDYAFDLLLSAGADPRVEDYGDATAYTMAHSEYMKKRLAEASAERANRDHEEWVKLQQKKKRLTQQERNKRNQCPLHP